MNRLQIISNHLLSKPFHFLKSSSSSDDDHHHRLPMVIHPDVQKSLERYGERNNVVALESTIISHGMPFPQNVQTARRVEQQIRKYGAIPATIAILDGVIHVGLTDSQLDRLGKLGANNVRKCSRRDLSLVCARGEHGATTVSATMIVAEMVGIKVFVTGGIGGVHRGVNDTMDVSTDLTELGRTPVCVVSAGVKSILDIPRTLEYLETQGVTVGSYRTEEFPAFFTSKSGCKSHCRFDTPEEVAKVIFMNQQLRIKSGILVAVPILPEDEAQAEKTNDATDQALAEAEQGGIKGKDVTPFLLQRINELTGGESLKANIALVLNNAKIGAQIAAARIKVSNLTAIPPTKSSHDQMISTTINSTQHKKQPQQKERLPKVICIGGCVLDISATPKQGLKLLPLTSNPGQVKLSFGGVARNCLELLRRLDMENVGFVTALGNDSFGFLLRNHLITDLKLSDESGIRQSKLVMNNKSNQFNRTAVYNCMIDERGEMVTAVADMDILERELDPDHVIQYLKSIVKTATTTTTTAEPIQIILFVDGNVSTETLKAICDFSAKTTVVGVKWEIFFEPTSVAKSVKPVIANCLSQIKYMKPNEEELLAMTEAATQQSCSNLTHYDCLRILITEHHAQHIFFTRGKHGVIHAFKQGKELLFNHYSAIPIEEENKVNVTGCGDNFAAALIYGLSNQYSIHESVQMGLRAAFLTLQCEESVHAQLNPTYILTQQPQEKDSMLQQTQHREQL